MVPAASTPPGLARARADIEAGRLWKARDRLFGLVRAFPADQTMLDLLGQVLFDMGDLPGAGRYWYLTERNDDASAQAARAFAHRHGSARAVAEQLPIYAPLSWYPDSVQLRVIELHEGHGLPVPEDPSVGANAIDQPQGWRSTVLGVTLVVITLGVWLFGLVALVVLAVRWLF